MHQQQAVVCARVEHPHHSHAHTHTPPILAPHAPLCSYLQGLPSSPATLLVLLPHLEWLYLEASACHLVALSLE